jgi:hypothetical protein
MELSTGLTIIGAVLVLATLVLLFNDQGLEQGQEARCMGGPVKDNGYGAKARLKDNNPKVLYDATKEFFANRKRDLDSFSAKTSRKE